MKLPDVLVIVVLTALAALAGWRIAVLGPANLPAGNAIDPVRTAWVNDPVSRVNAARDLLDQGDLQRAAGQARDILQQAPLQAGALVILARVASKRGQADAPELFGRALARAPRNQVARAWMIDRQLGQGDYATALDNITILLNIARGRRTTILPLLAALAEDAAFAAALVATLQQSPDWRGQMLQLLLQDGDSAAIAAVYGGLQQADALTSEERRAWLDHLMQEGHWGEAYSRWASSLVTDDRTVLPLVHDGGFGKPPGDGGFDWHMDGARGVMIERVVDGGDRVAKVTFFGRRVSDSLFYQRLLLAPGRYRLRYRARAQGLRSTAGLVWAIRCLGDRGKDMPGPRLEGDFAWTDMHMSFVIPPQGCPAQALTLVNPGPAGPGKIVSGSLWVDDFRITPLADKQGAVDNP